MRFLVCLLSSCFFVLALTPPLHAQLTVKTHVVDNDKMTYFAEAGVFGSFSLYHLNTQELYLVNRKRHTQRFIPASTYKIPNSLIGLETGVIPDTSYIIKWDGKERSIEAWNRDHWLGSAFRYSVVPYYQELARRVGEKAMRQWIKKAKYGNSNINGGIDQFWLNGQLRISPAEQLDFLVRLYQNKLPFSQRSMDLVKQIMVMEVGNGYVIRGKTGWASDWGEPYDVGWFVGYVEKGDQVWFFATCIQDEAPDAAFAPSRVQITKRLLVERGILPK